MLPQRLQGIGTEYTMAPNSMSGATKIFLHLVQMNNVFPRTISYCLSDSLTAVSVRHPPPVQFQRPCAELRMRIEDTTAFLLEPIQ